MCLEPPKLVRGPFPWKHSWKKGQQAKKQHLFAPTLSITNDEDDHVLGLLKQTHVVFMAGNNKTPYNFNSHLGAAQTQLKLSQLQIAR